VGIILDDAVLLDYDGHSADAEGSFIPTLEQLPKVVGVDILPPPAQVGKNGRSVHYLFKLPPGEYKASADGKLMPRIDIKCQNQVMHLSPEKQLKLPSKSALTVAPKKLLDLLSKSGERAYTSFEAHEQALYSDNTGWHSAVIGLTGKMVSRGWSDDEIWDYFNQARPRLAALRPDRVDALFADSIPRGIDSARDKGWTPVVPFEEEAEPEMWYDPWVYVTTDDRFYNTNNGLYISTKAFNNTYLGQQKKPLAATYVLENHLVPVADAAMYAPQFGTQFTYNRKDYVNLYAPWSTPNAAAVFSSVYEEHLKRMFPNDWLTIAQWMSWVVQNPGKKVLWALLLKGVQGDGKSTLGAMLRAAMGTENANEISMDSVKSPFNGWAANSCLGIVEEIRVSGQNRYAIMDKLKPLITNSLIDVVRKGMDGQTVINTVNYLLLTNHEDALPVDAEDRRYGVFFTQWSTNDEVPEAHKNTDHIYQRLGANPGEVKAWLESIDISGFNPNKAPLMTDAKRKMMLQSRPEHVHVLEDALTWHIPGVHKDAFCTSAINNLIREMHLGPELKTSLLTKAAEVLGYVKYEHVIKWKGASHRAYVRKGCNLSNAEIRALWDSQSNFEDES